MCFIFNRSWKKGFNKERDSIEAVLLGFGEDVRDMKILSVGLNNVAVGLAENGADVSVLTRNEKSYENAHKFQGELPIGVQKKISVSFGDVYNGGIPQFVDKFDAVYLGDSLDQFMKDVSTGFPTNFALIDQKLVSVLERVRHRGKIYMSEPLSVMGFLTENSDEIKEFKTIEVTAGQILGDDSYEFVNNFIPIKSYFPKSRALEMCVVDEDLSDMCRALEFEKNSKGIFMPKVAYRV